jgi:CheY-like chemotaxis protein/nitrogen-specific signal transduction histidine kinase
MVLFTNWVGATMLQYETNEQLQLEKEKAERAAKAKADFLSVMSHEIRTPLSGIIGITDLLLRDEPRKDQFKNLNLLKFSGDNLLVIINDILDFNKIEANKTVLEQIEFNLFGLLESVQQTNNFKIDGNELSLLVDYDQQLQQVYVGDAVRLGQVINNLTSNAIKFTKKGTVTLKVSLVAKHEGYHSLKIAVIDTGKGIKAENFAKIFEDYSQEEDSTTREYGGTGLGLPISQKLLNLMGSEMQLDSQVGQGSNFYFYIDFPIVQVSALLLGEIEVSEFDDLSSYGLNVLVVDDNIINYTIAANFLEKWGIKVNHAMNGELAIDLAKEHEFDLILMDLQMPEMDGYEAASAIRKFNAKVPIIALTASQLEEVRDAVASAGMNDLLRKPMTPQQLYSILAANLSIEHSFNSKAPVPLNSFDLQYLHIENGLNELSLNDATFKKELIKLMVLNVEELKTVLTKAVKKGEKELANAVVHKVKMTVNTLQLTSLNKISDEIIDYIASSKDNEQHKNELILKLDKSIGEVVKMLASALDQME